MNVKERIQILSKAFSNRMKKDDTFYDIVCLAAGAAVAWCPPVGAVAMLLKQSHQNDTAKNHRAVSNSFYDLKRRGFIEIERQKGVMRISFTDKGKQCKKLVELLQQFKQKSGDKWKGEWYIVMFDVKNEHRTIRDALRLFLRKMGFVQMQKSVWIYPHDCREELDFLRNFFDLKERNLRLLTTDKIGDDRYFRKMFKI
ncbi:MAG: hypothetical protein Q7R88_02595 [bacterium]|nr:hypothetical protein [bacterium]